jgi:serine/threonine-protein kinase
MADEDMRVLGNRYEIHRRLARGGMAQVYLARDQMLDRPVAVKELVAEFASDPSFVERFRREAQAAANLAHPNIVGVYDWGTQDGTYFIVMEYVDGPSLSQVIRRDGPLHPHRSAELASEVAAALGFAHSRGVVHRDVKPGNVLLTGSGQAKVTDFGIARALSAPDDDLTQAGSVMGTATYFSPEQAQGLPVDPRSDLYSLGVVLYEMVTARTPFTGDTPLAIAYKHVQDPPPPPSTIIPDLPAGVEAIIMKLLRKRPDERYSSAEDLRADLRRYLDGEVTNAERELGAVLGASGGSMEATTVQPATRVDPPTEVPSVPDEDQPKSRTGWFLAALVLLLALLAGGLFWFANDLSSTEVEVPDLVGETREEAERRLEDLELKAEVTEEASDSVKAGTVISQDPEKGASVKKESTVKLVVSTGVAKVSVPDLRGMTQAEAEQALTAAKLKFTVQSFEDPESEPGKVIGQDPAAGAEVAEQSSVKIVVSKGPGEEIVPDVAGQSLSSAQSALQALGFRIGGPDEQPSADVPKGQVIGTDPPAGSSLEKGATVTVLVSSGVEQVTVPDVRNQAEASATQTLQNRGLEVEVQTKSVPSGDPSIGRVSAQDPAGGTEVDSGSTVTIIVGVASAPTTTTSPSSSTSSTTSTTSP